MNVELLLAGLICVAVALGHATLGIVWVLPRLTTARIPATPFGPPAMTEAMVRVSWHIVTTFALGVGTLLVTLATSADAGARGLVLRWVAGMFVAATAIALYATRRRPRSLLRFPVWSLWVLIAVLCWEAAG